MSDFATVEQAIEDIKNGKMVVVVDDEDRENEGDLIVAAETVTPQDINFMATYAKGLICTPIDGKRLDELNIGQMVVNNTDNHETAFTVSIDAYDTETGISAFERCQTVKKLLDPKAKPASFRRPGHVFPLRSVEGGVLRRAGHTETTTDLARLAGFYPAGLCCEIMDDDGHMMRTASTSSRSNPSSSTANARKTSSTKSRMSTFRANTATSASMLMRTNSTTNAILRLSRAKCAARRTCSCAFTPSA